MSTTIRYTQCPVCGSTAIRNVLSVKDKSVSGETFPVDECGQCGLRFTQNIPDAESIIPYYRSDNYISHSNTAKGIINRMYQAVRKRTLKQKRKLVGRVTGIKKGVLLDIGSGTGAFVREMVMHGWQVMGLEPDEGARVVAREQFDTELKEINWFYELRDGVFDAITLWHVLEHVHDLPGYVSRCRNLLKENGRLIIAVPNYTSKDADIYHDSWAAYDVPRHLYHFSPASMKTLMERNGMKILQYHPMWYDSFYISLLSSKYKNGKTNFFGAFFNGLRSNLAALGDKKRCSSVIYVIGK